MKLRPAAIAGAFYPADPSLLAAHIDGFLESASVIEDAPPKALVCPHAGTIYSGATAGIGYRCLCGGRDVIRRVVIFGPTHRVAVRGLALPSADAFATPLGLVPIDAHGRASALTLPSVVVSDAVHAQEHSLEVQLPFLQRKLGDFSLLPFAVGAASPDEVAAVIDACWGGDETLIVISTDLSHFHAYRDACAIDRATIEQTLALDARLDHEQACGATPLNGLLIVARRRGLRASLLDLRNSGDTAGDKGRVVGYAALRFDLPSPGATQ